MKFLVWAKQAYKKVRIFFLTHKKVVLTTCFFIVFTIILFQSGLLASLARVGFNQNILIDQNIPGEVWYHKLVNKKNGSGLTYETWDGTIANEFAAGTGKKEDPYLVSNGSELAYINNLLESTVHVHNDTGETCINDTLEYTATLTQTMEVINWQNVYTSTKTLTIKNNSDKDLTYINLSFTKNVNATMKEVSYARETGNIVDGVPEVETILLTHNVNNNNVTATGTFTIPANSEYKLNIIYTSYNSNLDVTNINFTMKDADNTEYYLTTSCHDEKYNSQNKYFKLTNNIDLNNLPFDGIGSASTPFEGVFDADFKEIKNLTIEDNADANIHYTGLINYVNNATIKNFTLNETKLTINGTGINYAGTLVGYASGNSKIYNNGIKKGEVAIERNSTTDSYIGGMVGYITGTTIVTNSYSYADINSTGTANTGMTVGGLVGFRTGSNIKLDDTNPKVYLLVMYGKVNVRNARSYQYVYNGTMFSARDTPTYCYYLWWGDTIDTNNGTSNTYAIFKSYDDMIADGFKAHLNNYRSMVNYYIGNDSKPNESVGTGFPDIAYWYSDNDEAFYPVTIKYKNNAEKYTKNYAFSEAEANQKFGAGNYIKTNLINNSNGNEKKTVYLKITEKDEANNDYTNHKITLPFNSKTANFKYGTTGKNGNYEMTLTGWTLTSVIQNGSPVTTQTAGSAINYNYVLRSGPGSAGKDINTVYAQGGYYLVPDGVTEITLTTRWAYTIYAKDQYNDMVYEYNYSMRDSWFYGATGADAGATGYTDQSAISTLQAAYTRAGSISHSSVYDVVIMLCGNLHYSPQTNNQGTGSNWANTSVPVTFTSVDYDNDLEPDYSLYTRNVHDETMGSIRFDFVGLLSIPQVGTVNAKLNEINLTTNAHFEVTETAATDRIDIRHAPSSFFKINGGYWNIYNVWQASASAKRKDYMYFGGNAKAIYLNCGSESTQTGGTVTQEIPAFVVAGGRIENLSATYFATVVNISNDVYFYVDGGYIDSFYSTYNSSLNKSATIEVNASYINNFYAGGHTESAFVRGGVETTIKNSRIGSFYGGPKFGTILNGSKSTIKNTEIDNFFGSGYGGTQTTEVNLTYDDSATCTNQSYIYNISNNCNSTSTGAYCFGRTNASYGIETGFYAMIYTKSQCVCKAFARYYSTLSAANVDYVTVNISDSTINNDFYGGGNKGKVDKSVVVNMNNTNVKGNVFGGGLSNATEQLQVYENTTGYTAPRFKSFTIDSEAIYPQKYTYTWSNDASKVSAGNPVNRNEKLLYSENADNLGEVNGSIHLNIKDSNIAGNIYGGGNLSEVNGSIHVNVLGKTVVKDSVYGGGNQANVNGITDVHIVGSTIDNVFGGGNEGEVVGDTTVTLMSNAQVTNVYGGGNQASVINSNIYVESGKVENVYGGSNSSGEVTTSNVNTGILNPVDIEYGNSAPVNPDECKNFALSETHSIYSSGQRRYLAISITNNTQVALTKYEIIASVDRITGITANTTGANVTYNGGQVIITKTQNIPAGSSYQVANASNSTNYIELTRQNRLLNPQISSVTVKAYDAAGNEYTLDSCLDLPPPPEIEYDEIERILNSEVTNVFGGNNVGGETHVANVTIGESTVDYVYGGGNLVSTYETHVSVVDKSNVINNIYGGGNHGIVTTNTTVNVVNGNIKGSAYAGGNGSEAIVYGDTIINVQGTSTIGHSVFGGGNAAETGSSITNDSLAITNITGGTIYGNVYGGPNTSKIWGEVDLNLGIDTATDNTLVPGEIHVAGTVFGGGEANANGDENYDFSFISVTTGIDIDIDATSHDITIDGSIFGSGNASSTSGYSNIYITNFGTREEPKKIISVQRTGNLTLDSSHLDLAGTTDRTNEFSSIVYSLSRIDDLLLANNSTLYLQNATNVVKKLTSRVTGDPSSALSTATIENGVVTTNVDNRVYMYINRAFNVIDSENLENGEYGEVKGMMFFGLYDQSRGNIPDTGLYNDKYKHGDTVASEDLYKFAGGSYVMGKHLVDHDITKDGFYSHFVDDAGVVTIDYVDPTPEDTTFYQWIIGEASTTFSITLTASKFATMGTDELSLIGFNKANTYFHIVGYSDGQLEDGVSLINPDDVPRVAETDEEALKTFGLKMTSSKSGWLTDGETSFISTDEQSTYNGTTNYISENSNDIPSLHFYLIHSKNILYDKDLGKVTIAMLGYIPIDEVTYDIRRIFIEVNMNTKFFDQDNYEAAMTPGKEYELFVNTKTNITSNSSLSAYYSLYIDKDTSIYKDGFHRVLTSTFNLPVNTRITMVDRTNEKMPVYYYYVVTQNDFDNPITQMGPDAMGTQRTFYVYPLSRFIRMGSTSENNNYSDERANITYFHEELKKNEEEFIFIVDYSEANIQETIMRAELLLELQDADGYVQYGTLGASRNNMVYNLIKGEGAHIDVNITKDREIAYAGQEFNLDTKNLFVQPSNGSMNIMDTNFTQEKMGLKLTLYDSNGNKVNGANLLGTLFYINDEAYSSRIDGSIRIKIADRVANVHTRIRVDLSKSILATDTYRIVIEAFGSPDGLYYGLTSSGVGETTIDIINEKYGINSYTDALSVIVDHKTGLTSKGVNTIDYNYEFTSQFPNPNIRVKLYRRNYDDTYSKEYELVDLSDYVSSTLTPSGNEHEYIINETPADTNKFSISLRDNLKTGTYRLAFEVYNADGYIGEVHNYIIIK